MTLKLSASNPVSQVFCGRWGQYWRGCRSFQVGFAAAQASDFRLWRSGPGRRGLEFSSSLIPRMVPRNHGDIGCSTRSQESGNCRRVRPSPRIETGDVCWQPGQKLMSGSFSIPVRQTPHRGQLNSMNQTCVKPGPTHLRTSDQRIEEVTGCDQKRTDSKLGRSAECSASEGNHWAGRTYCLPGCAARSMALAISPRPPVLSEFD